MELVLVFNVPDAIIFLKKSLPVQETFFRIKGYGIY